MRNTDKIQGAGSRSLASQLHSKKRSELFYGLRQLTKLQRPPGGNGRRGPRGGERGPHGLRGEPRGEPFTRLPASPGPVSSASDFWQNPAEFPGPVPAGIQDDLSRALALLQSAHGSLVGPAGVSPSSECLSQACLLEELPASNRERFYYRQNRLHASIKLVGGCRVLSH